METILLTGKGTPIYELHFFKLVSLHKFWLFLLTLCCEFHFSSFAVYYSKKKIVIKRLVTKRSSLVWLKSKVLSQVLFQRNSDLNHSIICIWQRHAC